MNGRVQPGRGSAAVHPAQAVLPIDQNYRSIVAAIAKREIRVSPMVENGAIGYSGIEGQNAVFPRMRRFDTGGKKMDHEEMDQGWEELQARIQARLGKYLRGGADQLEYKPGSVLHLLEMPAGDRTGLSGGKGSHVLPR